MSYASGILACQQGRSDGTPPASRWGRTGVGALPVSALPRSPSRLGRDSNKPPAPRTPSRWWPFLDASHFCPRSCLMASARASTHSRQKQGPPPRNHGRAVLSRAQNQMVYQRSSHVKWSYSLTGQTHLSGESVQEFEQAVLVPPGLEAFALGQKRGGCQEWRLRSPFRGSLICAHRAACPWRQDGEWKAQGTATPANQLGSLRRCPPRGAHLRAPQACSRMQSPATGEADPKEVAIQ